jgi:hypothetical protein
VAPSYIVHDKLLLCSEPEQHWRVNYTYLKCYPYISPHSINLQRHDVTAAAVALTVAVAGTEAGAAATVAVADAAVVTATTS